MLWNITDFIIASGLIAFASVSTLLVLRMFKTATARFGAIIAIGAAFLLFWVNGAVGIIGSENNDANLMVTGVLVVFIMGAVISRLQPKGLSRAMLATALTQLSIGVIALLGNFGAEGNARPWDLIAATCFFTTLWLLSAFLLSKTHAPKGQ